MTAPILMASVQNRAISSALSCQFNQHEGLGFIHAGKPLAFDGTTDKKMLALIRAVAANDARIKEAA